MYGVLLAVHLLVCFALVAVVLLQSGKGGGLAGGAFGGATQTVFGGRGATDFITRATIVLGVAFFVTSVSLSILSGRGPGTTRSIIQEQARRTQSLPAAPTQAPAPAPATGGSTPPSGGAPAPTSGNR